MSLPESFRDEQDDTDTCMLHLNPPGPHSGTVTCILEILSPQWLLCLSFGPFIFDGLSERTVFFFMFFYMENVNTVEGRWSLGCEALCHTRDPLKLEMEMGEGPHQRQTLWRCRTFGGVASENVYDSDGCEYKCTNAEAHFLSLLSSTETCVISCHNTSWYFTVIQRSEKKKQKKGLL